MVSNSEVDLPSGWKKARIEDVCYKVTDGSHNPPKAQEVGKPMLSAKNIFNSKIDFKDCRLITEDDFEIEHKRTRIKKGDVLLTTVATLGRTAIVKRGDEYFTLQRSVSVLSSDHLPPGFLKYALDSPDIQSFIKMNARGNAQKGFYIKQLKELEIRVAPLTEQKRIVNKLDTLLAQVDSIQQRLNLVPDIIKRFRQSVLAAAVSGKLTEEWRGNSEYDDEGYPVNWERRGLNDLGELSRGKSKHRPRNDPQLFGESYPFIQTGEVARSNGEITTCSKWYSDFGLAQSRQFPAETLCITIAANIADTAILKLDACFPDSVVGFIANENTTLALFVKYLIDVNKNHLEQFAPATAQKNINLKVLNSLKLPYPPLNEQHEIVRQVKKYFALADTLEKHLANAKAKVDNLTQSILAKAFRGELVPQDPNDEPAEKLLERIKAARVEAEAIEKAAKKAARSKKTKKPDVV